MLRPQRAGFKLCRKLVFEPEYREREEALLQ